MAWAWEQNVPSTVKFILLALADHADNDGTCWPGQAGVADKTGFGRQTVNKAVQTLEELGLLNVEHRFDNLGRPTSNYYYLHLKQGGNVVVGDIECRPERQGGVVEGDTNHSEEPIKESIDRLDSDFEGFYAIYPRREAKADARRAWRKLNPDSELQHRITADLPRFREKERQFVPLPATYLRGRRWEDERTVTVAAPIPEPIVRARSENAEAMAETLTPEQRAANRQKLSDIAAGLKCA
jgi:biotin operon repressor